MKTRLIILFTSLSLVACTTTPPDAPSPSSQSISSIPSSSSAASVAGTSLGHDPVTGFAYPLPDAANRIIKKPFGIFVSPQSSPVQPERFTGFHTGTDFETFASEKNAAVTAHAICNGTVLYRGWVSGYGGVMIQSCTYQKQSVTVLYGHLNVNTITKNKGDAVKTGDAIGNLGLGYSHETDGERKHLHVSVHKGSSIDFKGYVPVQSQLSQWIDAYPNHP
ncbi:MAG TPA: M23 family metallopeptidase [Candidatus Peribacteraceae bacterium]|nr:M23 family metallopeptidase [Candidatus Peribacteraceae bacterium]